MNEQSAIMREQLDAAKAEQSPRLAFSQLYVSPPVIDEHLHGTITVRNSGKLPATILLHKVGVEFSPIIGLETLTYHSRQAQIDCSIRYKDILEELSREDGHLATHSIVHPGEPYTFEWSSTKLLTDEEVAKFNGAGCGFALVAHVEYNDPVGGFYETSNCFFYTLNAGIAVKLPRYDRTEKDKDRPFPQSAAIPWTQAQKDAAEAKRSAK